MSGDARDFNNIKMQDVIKFLFFFLQDKAPNEIHSILIEILGEHAPWYATVKNWVAHLKVVIYPPVMYLVITAMETWLDGQTFEFF